MEELHYCAQKNSARLLSGAPPELETSVMEKKPDASLKTEVFFVVLVLAIVAIDVVNRV